SVLATNGFNRFCIAGASPDMHTDEASSLRCDQPLDHLGIDIVGARVHVRKNRFDFLPLQSMGCGDKRVGGQDNLTLEFQSPNSNFQSHCAVTHCDTVLHANIVSDASFKLLNQWTVISQP